MVAQPRSGKSVMYLTGSTLSTERDMGKSGPLKIKRSLVSLGDVPGVDLQFLGVVSSDYGGHPDLQGGPLPVTKWRYGPGRRVISPHLLPYVIGVHLVKG